MSIDFDTVKNTKETYKCDVFFETGFYHGKRFQYAIDAGFEHVVSIELLNRFVTLGQNKFKNHIESGRARIINDDSANISKYIDEYKDKKIMFWFDAHLDNGLNSAATDPASVCPLLSELSALEKLNIKPVVLIDDLRCIRELHWGLAPGELTIEKILEKIKQSKFDWNIEYLDATEKQDVMLLH